MLALFLTMALATQEDGAKKNSTTTAEMPAFSGDLLRIEEDKIVLGIRKDGLKAGEQTFKISDDTKVFINGDEVDLANLRIGRPVKVTHREGVAVRIDMPKPQGEARRAVQRGEGDRPVAREGERRDGDRPPAREGERRDGDAPPGERPAVNRKEERERDNDAADARRRAEEKAREEAPFPVDRAIVPPTEKQPDHGGVVLSVFDDDVITLITIRRGTTEVPLFLPKGTPATYVGIEKENQKPTAGYVAYIWLKEGSRDTAARVTFGPEKKK